MKIIGINIEKAKTLNTKKSVIEGIIIAPPGARRSKQLKNFIPYSTGFCSGWTLNSKRDFDKGFTISDHADWNDLIKTIEQTTNATSNRIPIEINTKLSVAIEKRKIDKAIRV